VLAEPRRRPSYIRRVFSHAANRTRQQITAVRNRILWSASLLLVGLLLGLVAEWLGVVQPSPSLNETFLRLVITSLAAPIMVGLLLIAGRFAFNLGGAPSQLHSEIESETKRLEEQVQSLLNSSPHPVVACSKDYRGVRLDVTNEGASALFSCEVRILAVSGKAMRSGPEPSSFERFAPIWESGQQNVAIPRGGTGSLFLTITEHSHPMFGITFPYTARQGRGFSISWTEAYEVAEDGSRTPFPPGHVTLEVMVLSEPSVSEEIVKHRFMISAFGDLQDLDQAVL
jgi:hypothetical protein